VQKLYTDYRQAMQQNDQVKVQNIVNLFEKAIEDYPDCIETYALFSQVRPKLARPFWPLQFFSIHSQTI
jgi:hypothetical protein